MKVSVLIPCYNAEQWIGEAIASSLAQDHADLEVIVVDDGSTDGSRDIIGSFGDRISAKFTPNHGGNAARNLLLGLSSGEWLQYLDADDYLLPYKIRGQARWLGSADLLPDVLLGPARMLMQGAEDDRARLVEIPRPHDPWILLARWLLPQTGAPLWRKAALESVGGWNERQMVCQEHELYLRLLVAGKRFAYADANGAVYRHWSEDTVCRRDMSQTYVERLRIVDGAEHHLRNSGDLTVPRQDAINQTRFICARIFWGWGGRASSLRLLEQIRSTGQDFSPDALTAPNVYRTLYKIFGFCLTETIASVTRFLRGGVAPSQATNSGGSHIRSGLRRKP